MNQSILYNKQFRFFFAGYWLVWMVLHAWILHQEIPVWSIVVTDSILQNVLLAIGVLVISNNMQYYLPKKHRFSYITWVALTISALVVYLSIKLLGWIFNHSTYQALLIQTHWLRLGAGFLIASSLSMFSMLWYVQQDQITTEARKATAEQLTKDAELFNLRQQLQPHFLFNSLNSISALTGTQPEKARHMIQQLSDFLRFTIRKDAKQWNTLHDELQYVQLYLDIEKVRFGHRLGFQIKGHESLAQLQIPALLLQPIVENAIKYGLYDTIDEVLISIELQYESPYLHIQVSNPFDAQTTAQVKGTGFGLSSVQRRMQLLFGRSDLIKTHHQNGIFTTILIIPQIQPNESTNN